MLFTNAKLICGARSWACAHAAFSVDVTSADEPQQSTGGSEGADKTNRSLVSADRRVLLIKKEKTTFLSD